MIDRTLQLNHISTLPTIIIYETEKYNKRSILSFQTWNEEKKNETDYVRVLNEYWIYNE